MADTVKVVCAWCAKHEWSISHVPGNVQLRCPKCNQNHGVTIDERGHLYVRRTCYLATAAIVAAGHDPDTSFELMQLRRWRDMSLAGTARGRELVDGYYQSAPSLLAGIEALPEDRSRELFHRIFGEFVVPICALLKENDEEGAFALASRLIGFVEEEVADVRRRGDHRSILG